MKPKRRCGFFDAESNTPIKDGSVTLNTSPLIQDAANLQLWKGKITVPEGGTDVVLTGVLADKTPVKSATKVFNKQNSINPNYLVVNTGIYLAFFDPAQGILGRLNLATNLWSAYLQDSILRNIFPIYDWNSHLQSYYLSIPTSEVLFAVSIASATPKLFYAGSIPGIVNLTYDNTSRRIIALTKTMELGVNRYRAVAMATDDTKGFADAKAENDAPLPAVTQLIWDLPNDIILGTFKYFNFHELSKTYIIADERSVNNIKRTIVQGFAENGQKKFEATIGPDISNLAIDEASAQVFVAENHSSAAGKIKAIDINSGEVRDLVQSYGSSAVGSYANIRIDPATKRLYVGDDVSDSIFVVDLVTHAMNELPFSPAVSWTTMPMPVEH